ncbi:MAG: phosphonoacetaldehyde hydrolase [Rhodospirillaceae bacterium]|nr:phosphonoacetaldehyde hydrolase [Rhodospirillaceae bacterium]
MTAGRPYRGPVKAVIFDWAGTIVDFGSCAPVQVFVDAFAACGIPVTPAEARGPMGLPKWDHIAAMGRIAHVADAWLRLHGHPFGAEDIDEVYRRFLPLQVETVARHAEPIPGAVEMIAALRRRHIAIGSTTGYSREVMAPLQPAAERHGITVDNVVCAGDLAAGRPSPLMCLQTMIALQVWPAEACVKVDDTTPGIEEGLNAGMWTVGVTVSGNEVGLTRDAFAALPPHEREARRGTAEAKMRAAGAHFVLDSVAGLAPVIDEIEARLAAGRRP